VLADKEICMSTTMAAEMVANVWKVLVSNGDSVAEGDTLLILESMKMELPVVAEIAGTVVSVDVAENDVVQEGQTLVVIDGS
jgi:acetyl-CoA carboxylase biotin carboxyl carrier protein